MGVPGSVNNLLGAGGAPAAYQIQRSIRLNSADSAYLSRTPASAGNRKTWTWAGWVKRSALTSSAYSLFAVYGDSSNRGYISYQGSTDKLLLFSRVGGSDIYEYSTNAVFRDASAWYHVVIAFDTTQATASNRLKIYVNGVEQSLTATTTVGQNVDTYFNATQPHYLGYQGGGDAYFSGYLADVHFIDGQALTPSSFTETSATTGQLIPKAYSGSFGTNGFWLKFSDNSAATATTLGKDYSGNSNNWTPNNLSVTAGAGNDSLTDTPTSYGTDTGAGGEVRGNYATLNPLAKGANVTIANGNLDYSVTASNGSVPTTIGMSSGKWYFECTVSAVFGTIGIAKQGYNASNYVGNDALSWGYNQGDGAIYTGASSTAYGATYTTNDVIGVALNADAGTLVFYKNGVSQGTAVTGLTSGPYFFAVGGVSSSGSTNFGQRPFAYTAPSGFKALCDTSLPAPTIALPSTVMDVKLYTGNSSTQTISGLGFSPDLVWLKQRTNAENHGLFDTVRGAQKSLCSNNTVAENATDTNSLTAFTSDGFSLGNTSRFNDNTYAHVAWAWDAGSSTTTNNSGSISSQVRANASAGFSIVTYTGNGTGGATVGHGGLVNLANGMIIIKRRDSAVNWFVGHGSQGWTKVFEGLNTTAAISTTSAAWNNTSPTSTVFTLGTETSMNGNGGTFVAYCFAPVAGYSSFGSYTGNGSATDGPFVFCGFRPRWILFKNTSQASDWAIYDSARSQYNVTNDYLTPNTSGAEGVDYTNGNFDILSNGFKIRATWIGENGSGNTLVYAAFAESPFQYARAR